MIDCRPTARKPNLAGIGGESLASIINLARNSGQNAENALRSCATYEGQHDARVSVNVLIITEEMKPVV